MIDLSEILDPIETRRIVVEYWSDGVMKYWRFTLTSSP
jgi:hypothetical protein